MSSSSSSSSKSETDAPAFGALQDVRCDVDIILGTGTMTVRECMQLRRHAVIRLEAIAGADLEMRVNGISIAYGEVVIVDDSTSLRLTTIVPPPSAETAS
jgi:flagellar motor switch protein FliN/FliY